MNIAAIEQSEERLSRAKDALKLLMGNGERKSRESAWIDLITALGTAFSKLEQGAKGDGRSEAWFGKKKHQRRNDQLLSYIHHARNVAEHRIAKSAAHSKYAVSFKGMLKPGTSVGLRLGNEGMEPFSTEPDMELLQFTKNDIHLMAVFDRGVLYYAPREHLGKVLTENGARSVGPLAVSYVESMISEARELIVL